MITELTIYEPEGMRVQFDLNNKPLQIQMMEGENMCIYMGTLDKLDFGIEISNTEAIKMARAILSFYE